LIIFFVFASIKNVARQIRAPRQLKIEYGGLAQSRKALLYKPVQASCADALPGGFEN